MTRKLLILNIFCALFTSFSYERVTRRIKITNRAGQLNWSDEQINCSDYLVTRQKIYDFVLGDGRINNNRSWSSRGNYFLLKLTNCQF